MKRPPWRWLLLIAAIAGGVWLGSSSVQEARHSPFTPRYQTRGSVEFGAVPLWRGEWRSAPNELLDHVRNTGLVEPLSMADPIWEMVYRQWNGRLNWSSPYFFLRPGRFQRFQDRLDV